MFAYHLVYDTRALGPPNLRVLVALKNVCGSRFGGKPTPPTVLNGAGQVVIPGGTVTAPDVISGGQIEFFEETGIDFRDPAVREQMKCTEDAWFGVLDEQKGAYCVYQQVENAELVKETCNEKIKCQVPQDQELHRAKLYDTSFVRKVFGPISGYDLNTGWRGAQYSQLGRQNKELADGKSQYSGDWYVKAVEQLRSGH